jgi:hypothetical protein
MIEESPPLRIVMFLGDHLDAIGIDRFGVMHNTAA